MIHDGLTLDLQKLLKLKCVDCEGTPNDEHPVLLAQKCHPGTGLMLAYVGGDKIVASCRMCTAFAFFMVVGESARPSVLDPAPHLGLEVRRHLRVLRGGQRPQHERVSVVRGHLVLAVEELQKETPR